MASSGFLRFILGSFITTSVLFAQESYTVDEVPNPKDNDGGWVSDPNNFLSLEEKSQINQLITGMENNTTAQIAVVMLPSIGNEIPKSFAVDLFEEWGIGQSEKDNGLLILTVIDQRRTEFETGYGLEPILTDAICYRIGSQQLVPHFKNGAYGDGLLAALKRIEQILNDPDVINEIYDSGGVAYEKKSSPFLYALYVYLIIMMIILVFYLSKTKSIDKSKEDLYDKYHDLKKMKHWVYMIFFPLPFILIRLLFVDKRLLKYRKHTRFSKVNGKEMFRKSERSDNAYLKKGEIVEEKIKSVDYDVWVTENEDDILILEYDKYNSKYSACKNCGYKTYYKARSKTTKSATTSSTGVRKITYKCKNCDYSKTKTIIIPKQSSNSGSSYSGGSSSGGGSSFGGGSSGGGGAGVSW